MWLPLLLTMLVASRLQQTTTAAAAAVVHDYDDRQLAAFIAEVEELVLNTTDRALIGTSNVYRNLSNEMSPQLRQASAKLMRDYSAAVSAALAVGANFTEKRKLFRQFKSNNLRIDQLRSQLDPLQSQPQFQLISDAFYSEARCNSTEFDNLYLEFMTRFERASQQLWDTMSERTVQEQEELLEILDEIANERQLREKDKLYDEFIEMYLFKPKGGAIENRELF